MQELRANTLGKAGNNKDAAVTFLRLDKVVKLLVAVLSILFLIKGVHFAQMRLNPWVEDWNVLVILA